MKTTLQNQFRNSVYFSAADQNMALYLRPLGFDRSLLLHVLFAPSEAGLEMRDVYFFTSNVEAHLRRSTDRPTLLEECLAKGFISCRFRSAEKNPSFSRILEIIRRQAVRGPVPGSDAIAARLDGFLKERRARPKVKQWGKRHLGRTFQSVVEKCICPDQVPQLYDADADQSAFAAMWNRTKSWRQDIVLRAVSQQPPDERIGLRRSIWEELVAKDLGHSTAFFNASQLHQAIHSISPEQAQDFKMLNKMFTQCYQLTGANCFGINASFPSVDPFSAYVIEKCSLGAITEPPVSRTKPEGFLATDISLPPLDKLLRLAPDDVFKMRDYGIGYRLALEKWANNPSASPLTLSLELTNYAKRISTIAGRSSSANGWSAYFGQSNLQDAMGEFIPKSGMVFAAVNCVIGVFRFLNPRVERPVIAYRASHRRAITELEMNFPAELLD